MARIYVSSTFSDLKDHREQVRLALRRLGHEDVAMEYYGATDERPIDKCLNDVASCDVYVGIFAWRYGYIPDGYDRSITELEYRHAVDTGKTCLIFILPEDADWPMTKIERSALDRIELFQKELRTAHTVDKFSSIDTLVANVSQAIANWQNEQSGIDKGEQEFLRLEQQYRELVIKHYSSMTIPNFHSEQRKVPITDLYVPPTFLEISNDKPKELNFEIFMKSIHRSVVLANPGGGKSTTAMKLCFDFATRYYEGLLNGKSVTPILIILRDYGIERQKNNCSVLGFIRLQIKRDFSLDFPEAGIEHLLSKERLMVIFDGLDELLNTSDRQDIANTIEAFCRVYPSTPVLVTSREVGYQDAPLDKESFSTYRITDFNTEQIQDYARKWFAFEEKPLSQTYEDMVHGFLEALDSVPMDLKSNPLLLALICTVYIGESYIPHNRPEIYEKCAELLFSKRDKQRRINDVLSEESLLPTIAYLAYWIYGNPELEQGVLRRKLIIKTTEYLQIRFDNPDKAEDVARKYVEFFTGRAWVFTDIGTDKYNEPLYQFTHRTFLEYFTARYLVSNHHTPEKLLQVLEPKLLNGEWSVVAELAFQRMALQVEMGADELLLPLVTKAKEVSEKEAIHLLAFAAKCLSFMRPKETTLQAILAVSIELGIRFAVTAIEEYGDEEIYGDYPFYDNVDFLVNVLRNSAFYRDQDALMFAVALEKILTPIITSGTNYKALIAAEIGLNLPSLFPRWRKKDNRFDEIREVLKSSSQKIIETCSDKLINHLAPKYLRVARDLYNWGKVDLAQLIEWHTTQSLFRQHYRLIISHVYDGEIVRDLMDIYDSDITENEKQYLVGELEKLGGILLPIPTPWTGLEAMDSKMGFYSARPLPDLNSNALFGVFLVLAFGHEYWYEDTPFDDGKREDYDSISPDYFYWIFASRFPTGHEGDEEKLQEALDKSGFNSEQRAFVERWAHRKISIIDH